MWKSRHGAGQTRELGHSSRACRRWCGIHKLRDHSPGNLLLGGPPLCKLQIPRGTRSWRLCVAGVKALEQKALVERGRYLFTVASCAFCHNPNGAGGQKISWRPLGTLWSRNLTSDVRTGIGAWTDEQIARAIRSGITPDGRTLHWQGMTWDHASN
jgi:mono/diheme cytochrome c family protein